MSLTLHVDATRWRAHLAKVVEATPGIVPVVKGNGYGFGRDRATAEAAALGCDTLAVGTYAEAPDALDSFGGDVLVLSPWHPGVELADPRLIHTVSRVADLAHLPAHTRVLAEGATSLRRHGMNPAELARAAEDPRVEGVTIHLPLAGHNDNAAEAGQWAARLSELPQATLFVSHLDQVELEHLRETHPELTIRPRMGTVLWLGDLGALRVTATVLDVHRVARGERIGYRQNPVRRAGHVLVVGAGTSQGIGLDAPKANRTAKDRVKSVARGSLEAAGAARSPFVVDGKQRWFAEPPHMHASMILLPEGARVPAVGDTVTAQVRFTTSCFDAIHFE